MSIRESLSKQTNLYEYTQEIIICMVITGKECSVPDIWPDTPNQATGTENIILTTWYKETMK